MQTIAPAHGISFFINRFCEKFFNPQMQMLMLKAFIASFLIGSGLVYGHFRISHLLGLIFLPYFLAKLARQPKLLLGADFLFLLAILAWYFLSLFWVSDRVLARNYLFYISVGYYFIFVFCLFVDSFEKLKQSLKILFGVALVDLGVGLVESWTSFRWIVARQSPLNKYFGIDPMYDYYYNNLIERLNKHAVSYEYMLHQPSGFQWGPNQFGLFLCLLLPFVLFYIRRLWVSMGLSVVILYLSFMIASRAVFLSELLTMSLAVVIFSFYSKQKFKYALALLVIVVAMPLAPLEELGVNAERAGKISSFLGAARNYLKNNLNFSGFEDYTPNELKDLNVLDAGEQEKFMDNSVSQRKILLLKSYNAFLESPWLGLGAGNSAQDVGLLFGTTQIHNFWIEIFFELGILFGGAVLVGVLLIFGKLCGHLRRIQKTGNEEQTLFLFAVIVSLVGSVPGLLAVGTGAYQPAIWILLAIALCSLRIFSSKKAQ